jgi:hypothetical protein
LSKRFLLACLAIAVVAPSASAATSVCVDLPDPAGDFKNVPVTMPFAHPLDLLHTHAIASATGVTAKFTVAADPVPTAPGTSLVYELDFHEASADYRITATLGPYIAGWQYELYRRNRVVQPGGNVTVDSWVRREATGSVDLATDTVTVTAPAALFGAAPIADGTAWTVTRSSTSLGAYVTTHGPWDNTPAGNAPLVAGDGTCA